MRVKAVIAYDGSAFEGFQRQTRTPNTVTGALEHALKTLGITSPITGSGRTDTGVHATGQVIHFDLPPYWEDTLRLRHHLNQHLRAIHIKHIAKVPDTFHARFDAKVRIYRYVFSQKRPTVFAEKYIAYLPDIQVESLEKSLKIFEGTHDFGYFKKQGSKTKNDRRTIFKTHVKSFKNFETITIEANGFLRAQIRMMLGAIFELSRGNLSEKQLIDQLNLREKYSTHLAPSEGLYLARILY